MKNWPRLKITPLGILYQNTFYKHDCYDFFSFQNDGIHFHKYFPNREVEIFTIHNLDNDEMNELLHILCQM